MTQKYRKFSLLLTASLTALFSSFACLFIMLGSVTSEDRETYHQLLMSLEGETEAAQSSHSIHRRTGLRKDLFFFDKEKQRHLMVSGDYSELHLISEPAHTELIEKMQGVKCRFKQEQETSPSAEKLYDILFIEADRASFSYKTEQLAADQVKIERACTKGPLFDDTPVLMKTTMSGTAEKAWIAHQDKGSHMKAEQFQAVLAEENHTTSDPPIEISSKQALFEGEVLQLQGDVLIKYGEQYTLTGDHAMYQKAELAASPTNPYAGSIVLYASENKRCLAKDAAGNEVRAARMTLDTGTHQVVLYCPEGTFRTGMGSIETEKEMRIFLHNQEGKTALHRVEAEGKTSLTYQDEEKKLSHFLLCDGQVKIDHQKMEARLTSFPNEEKQIFFRNELGEIYADKALIKYRFVEDRVVPQQISLLGNVRIIHRLAAEGEQKQTMHAALADRLDHYPETGEMFLKAASQKRVILYDGQKNVEISAPEVKIVRNKETGKDTIQGIGDVRFKLTAEEFERLRQKCILEKN